MTNEQWEHVLENLKLKNNTIYGIARMAEATNTDGYLELRFKFPFHLKRLSEQRNLQIIADLASTVLAINMKIRTMDGDTVVCEASAIHQPETTTPETEDVPEKDLPDFYLCSLKISNFRVFNKIGETIKFQPGLNVILGENNTGKSAVIDALRYVFNLGSYQKKDDLIKIDDQDVHRDGSALNNEETLEFEMSFASKEAFVMSKLPDIYCEQDESGLYLFKMNHKLILKKSTLEGRHVYKTSLTYGGKELDNPVTTDTLDYIRSVYLSALRDIVADSKKVGLEVEKLIRSQLSRADKAKNDRLDQLPKEMRTKILDAIHDITGEDYKLKVGQGLLDYSKPYLNGDPANLITFSPYSINRNLYRTMQPLFSYEEHGEGGLDLEANGLGVNNLIYSSIVLSRKKHDEDFRFFLIEEPEAHLHPQILRTFFGELNKIKTHQVFVTSHSAMITAETDICKVILMKRTSGANPTIVHLNDIYGNDTNETHRKYLHKFLDATKSQLLFARSAIFVEGISEALLLEKFATLMGKSLRESGVEVVVLGAKGGFDHFKPLFEAVEGWRCAFITDDDCAFVDIETCQPKIPNITDSSPHTYEGVGTFEYELLRTAKQADDAASETKRVDKLQSAFKKSCASGSTTFFDAENLMLSYKRMKDKATAEEWGVEGLKSNSNFKKSKSEFSFQLEQLLEAGDDSMVPEYIRAAINYVTQPTEEPEDDNTQSTSETDPLER